MIRTVPIPLHENLFQDLDQTAHSVGMPVGEFVQLLLPHLLREWTITELEQQEIEAYHRQPVQPGEFALWKAEQVWGEP